MKAGSRWQNILTGDKVTILEVDLYSSSKHKEGKDLTVEDWRVDYRKAVSVQWATGKEEYEFIKPLRVFQIVYRELNELNLIQSESI